MSNNEEFNPLAVPGHNSEGEDKRSEKEKIFDGIKSLYEEAAVWADGSPIDNEQQHDAVTAVRAAIHELGKQADALREEEKRPHDEAAKAVQAEFNPYVQKGKGKVDKAKAALDVVLGKWRVEVNRRKEEIARIQREEAAAEMRKAQEAIRSSSGNLQARDDAEEQLERAKQTETFARRAERQATTGTGLRTVRSIELIDTDKGRQDAMDWAFDQDAERFYRLAVDMAAEHFRATTRVAPGFTLEERKVASGR